MSEPPFEVAFDPSRRLLRWTMRGMWSVADVDAFARALNAAVRHLGSPPRRYDGLGDTRDFPVQTGDVSTALGEVGRLGAQNRDGRVAIVVGSMMNKLQVQRTFVDPRYRAFLSLQEAEAWLQHPPTDDR